MLEGFLFEIGFFRDSTRIWNRTQPMPSFMIRGAYLHPSTRWNGMSETISLVDSATQKPEECAMQNSLWKGVIFLWWQPSLSRRARRSSFGTNINSRFRLTFQLCFFNSWIVPFISWIIHTLNFGNENCHVSPAWFIHTLDYSHGLFIVIS